MHCLPEVFEAVTEVTARPGGGDMLALLPVPRALAPRVGSSSASFQPPG